MTKRIGALLLSILLVLTLLPANAYAAKVTQPTIKTKLTVKVGAKKTAKITAGGWTIKSVKVAKYSKKGIVTGKNGCVNRRSHFPRRLLPENENKNV